jgi:hypothetical protein
MSPRGDAGLLDWNALKDEEHWRSILLGNGASCVVWDRFNYASLFEVARNPGPSQRLSASDVGLFKALKSGENFESVLGALITSQAVCGALKLSTATIEARYDSIKNALIAAVHHVHVPWTSVDKPRLIHIRRALLEYEHVFSTNYDLLVYWSIMAETPGDFKDYFWGQQFDIANAEIWGRVTKVLYLHGGLHLYHDVGTAATCKEQAAQSVNLLALFGKRPGTYPLCITEGTADQKLAAIRRSGYLQFALQQFAAETGALVVFGHSLSDEDSHLTSLMARTADRPIAVSIYPSSTTQIVREKAWYQRKLPQANLHFFDSRTHPLGDASLRVGP